MENGSGDSFDPLQTFGEGNDGDFTTFDRTFEGFVDSITREIPGGRSRTVDFIVGGEVVVSFEAGNEGLWAGVLEIAGRSRTVELIVFAEGAEGSATFVCGAPEGRPAESRDNLNFEVFGRLMAVRFWKDPPFLASSVAFEDAPVVVDACGGSTEWNFFPSGPAVYT